MAICKGCYQEFPDDETRVVMQIVLHPTRCFYNDFCLECADEEEITQQQDSDDRRIA